MGPPPGDDAQRAGPLVLPAIVCEHVAVESAEVEGVRGAGAGRKFDRRDCLFDAEEGAKPAETGGEVEVLSDDITGEGLVKQRRACLETANHRAAEVGKAHPLDADGLKANDRMPGPLQPTAPTPGVVVSEAKQSVEQVDRWRECGVADQRRRGKKSVLALKRLRQSLRRVLADDDVVVDEQHVRCPRREQAGVALSGTGSVGPQHGDRSRHVRRPRRVSRQDNDDLLRRPGLLEQRVDRRQEGGTCPQARHDCCIGFDD